MTRTTRALSILLCASLLAPGCAVRSGAPSFQARTGAWSTGTDPGAQIPRSYVEQLPVGKAVEVRLRSGERFKATLMGVEGEAVRLQPLKRIPVAPRLVPLSDLSELRLAGSGGGGSVAKAVLAGAASGAALFFSLLLVAIAASGD